MASVCVQHNGSAQTVPFELALEIATTMASVPMAHATASRGGLVLSAPHRNARIVAPTMENAKMGHVCATLATQEWIVLATCAPMPVRTTVFAITDSVSATKDLQERIVRCADVTRIVLGMELVSMAAAFATRLG